MKKTLLVLLFISSTLLLEASTSKDKKIEELFKVMKSDQMINKIYAQMTNVFMLGKPQNITPKQNTIFNKYEKKLIRLLQEKVSWKQFRVPLTKVYSKHFTEEQITDLINFYNTPTGKVLLEKTPMVAGESMRASQLLIKNILPDLEKLSKGMANELKTAN